MTKQAAPNTLLGFGNRISSWTSFSSLSNSFRYKKWSNFLEKSLDIRCTSPSSRHAAYMQSSAEVIERHVPTLLIEERDSFLEMFYISNIESKINWSQRKFVTFKNASAFPFQFSFLFRNIRRFCFWPELVFICFDCENVVSY